MADPIIVGGVPARGFSLADTNPQLGRIGPYPAPGGDVIVFGFSGWNEDAFGVPNGSPSRIAAYTSADNGVTWALADGVNSRQAYRADFTGPTGDPATFWAQPYRIFDTCKHPVNEEVYVVFASLAGVISIARFDLTTQTWTGQWNSVVAIQAQAFLLPTGNSASIPPVIEFETTTDDLVICYCTASIVNPAEMVLTRYMRFDTVASAFFVPGLLLTDTTTGWDEIHGLVRGTGGRVHALLVGSTTGAWDPLNLISGSLHALAADGAGASGSARQVIVADPMFVRSIQAMRLSGTQVCVVINDSTGPLPPANNGVLYWANSANVPVWNSVIPISTMLALTQPALGLDPATGNVLWLTVNGLGPVEPLQYAAFNGVGVGVPVDLIPAVDGPFDLYWSNPLPGLGFGVVYGKTGPGFTTASPLFYSLFGAPPPPPPPPPGIPSGPGGGGAVIGFGGVIPGVPGLLMPLVVGKNYVPSPNLFDKMLRKMCECYSRVDWMGMSCPWLGLWDGASMPNGAIEYLESFTIVTPAAGPGVLVLVGWVDIPLGYESMIYGLTLHYTGTGFVEGSGDIIWRVLTGNRWLKGYGNSLFSRGLPSQPFPLSDHVRVKSGSRIWIGVEVPNGSGLIQVGASNIICAVQGWHYPI